MLALPKNIRDVSNLGDFAINELRDINFGNRLKAGDTTILKYHIRDGDGSDDERADLSEYRATAVLKHKGIEAYRTGAVVTKEAVPGADEEGWVARFWIDEVLKADRQTPYNIEIVLEKDDEADGRLIFPSDNDQLVLYIESSSLSGEVEAVDLLDDDRLAKIAQGVFDKNPIFKQAEQAEEMRIMSEKERQEAEAERQRKEKERLQAETERERAESERHSRESERVRAESGRVSKESERAEKEADRLEAERQRGIAEQSRADRELERVEQEKLRKSAELERVSAEETRADKEASRVEAESVREANERKRQANESERQQAETVRSSAESGRASAESLREQAEEQRALNETDRQSKYKSLTESANRTIEQVNKATENSGIYTAGKGIVIDDQGRINAEIDPAILEGKIDEPSEEGLDGYVLSTDGQGGRQWIKVEDKDTVYSAGTNVEISPDNKISAKDTVYDDSEIKALIADKADRNHTHPQIEAMTREVDESRELIDSKADKSHTHAISEVEGLQSQLDGKADADHTHNIADVANLQSQLDLKANSTHLHDERYSKISHTHSEYALKSEVPKIKQVTQSEYDGLSKKDDNTLYLVVE